MAHKIISITEELYRELEKRKLPGESFSNVIARLLQRRNKPSKYLGSWSDITIDENEMLEEARIELRLFWTG
jgi:predicted CopG family antitoxin